MPTLAYFYKLGFLTCCADRGLGPEEAELLAEKVLSKQASAPAAIGGVIGAAISPQGRRLPGAGHGALRGLGVDLGAGLGSLAGGGLGALAGLGAGGLIDQYGGLPSEGSAMVPGATIGGLGGGSFGIGAGGWLGYLLASKLAPNPPWRQQPSPINTSWATDTLAQAQAVAKPSMLPQVVSMPIHGGRKVADLSIGGLASGAAAFPGHLLRHVGNIGASTGLGVGGLLYGDGRPEGLRPSGPDAEHAKLQRMMAMTAEIKRRKARLVRNPGLFA